MPGIPLPKGSPDILRASGSGRPFVRESEDVIGWAGAIAETAALTWREWIRREVLPLAGPVRLELAFTLPRQGRASKSEPQRKELAAVKPDLDKLARCVLDALEAVAYVNDSRVTSLALSKRAAWRRFTPGVHVALWPDGGN